MSNTIEQLQVLYEIAMSIGTSLELRPMLKTSLAVLLKKLNCSAGGVLLYQPCPLSSQGLDDSVEIQFEEVFTIPLRNANNKAFHAAVRYIPKTIPIHQLGDFIRQLPLSGQETSGSYFYIFELPDIGVLILTKYGERLDDILLKSVKLLSNKLANACKACLQNAALRESEERYRSLYVDSKDAIMIFSPNQGFIAGNPATVKIFACRDEKDFIAKTTTDLSPVYQSDGSASIDKSLEMIRKALETGSHFFEWTHQRCDGRTFPATVLLSRLSSDLVQATVRDITEQKQAEENIRKLYRAVDQSPASIVITDPQGNIEYVNPKFSRLTGYTLEEVIDKNPRILKSGETPIEEYARLWGMLIEGKTWYGEFHNKKKNGELYWESASISPILDEKGTITNFLAVKEDITERKRAEELLKQNESQYRLLADHMKDTVWLMDMNLRTTYISPSVEKLRGFTLQEIQQLPLDRQLTPTSYTVALETFSSEIQKVMADPSYLISLTIELEFYRKDGTTYWSENSFNLIRDEKGTPISIMGEGRDVTDRKRAEAALRTSENQYRNLFEQANEAILIFEPEKEMILEANSKACEIYGYTQEEFVGKSLKNVSKDIGRGQHAIDQLLTNNSLKGFETIHFRKDGSEIHFLINASNIQYNGVKAILSIGRDITEQKKLQQELHQSQKMLSIGTLAGGIAHDFNNILNIILGYSMLLEKRNNQPDKFSEGIHAIAHAVDRGTALVRQILTFARKTETAFAPVSIQELVRELFSMLKQTFPKVITFKASLDDTLPLIHADHSQLHQVFLNLCVNARDAMPQGGSITLTAEVQQHKHVQERFPAADKERYVCIAVADTGEGMDEKTRARIFDPFFTTKEHGKGTGLGLAVVYGIIQAHHGFIDVKSILHQGTVIYIYLPIPVLEEEIQQPQIPSETELRQGTETILIVEDEDFLLDMLTIVLESQGYTTLKAGDGKQAVELYQQNQMEIDLVVTDMGLPEMTGKDEFKELMKINPNVKVILASGFLDPEMRTELLQAGAKGFIQKPYRPESILRIIQNVLDAR